MKHVETVVRAVIDAGAHKATKFISPKLVIRATQRLYRRKAAAKRDDADIVLTIGRPNYAERKFIAACKKGSEPFPVRKVQLKFPPKRK